ncbi:hypothetical protein GGI21_000421 [Coemansia aciculifera]|uniref:Uncharacterized protein n=1 Tax=Coemansia aciculifera TaxID=417176 RepID=A0ACC1M2F3_9FUNG|nr:hypothetical protein IWW38_002792 [Coemansia aciculifera]KAJ2910869.1 hypothetical protein GGI21_000421 [Coemansia aciculifera]
MGLNTSTLKLTRFYLYIAAIVLTVVTFIVDAVALASLKTYYYGGYSFGFSTLRGAAGFTMFVCIVALFLTPSLAFGNVLARTGALGFIEILNRVLYEVIAVSVLGLFWFIAACVMASYADVECFDGWSMCGKFKAATAFTWLTFGAVLALSIVLGLMLHVVRTSNGSIKDTLSYNIDGEYAPRANAAGGAAAVESHPYPGAAAGGNSYYNSSPAVNMPVPGDK